MMFDWMVLSLITELFTGWNENPPPLTPVRELAWEELALFSLPHAPDPRIEETVESYLQRLSGLGIASASQGVWLASDWWTFADHRGKIPQSAASLTKIATSLAALETYGINHRFETVVKRTGTIENGVLKGDLVIEGGDDPFFVWEEAIALGNRLNELGIRQVQGDLIITGNFFMNYEADAQTSAQLLAQALDEQSWSWEVEKQYQKMLPQTSRPQVTILGNVVVQNQDEITTATPMIRHQSLPLKNILQQMNIYSNNKMADLIARSLGGIQQLVEIVTEVADVSPQEVQLINASGLGVDNRLSPRAVTKMLRIIHEKLEENGGTVADIFPVTGIGQGTVRDRAIPDGLAVKTGTLWNVSALAGVIPTERQGFVYFAIINQDGNIDLFRNQQDQLLNNLQQQWQIVPLTSDSIVQLGDRNRNL